MLWSASPSDRRSMFRLFFASGTAPRENSQKISKQVPQPPPASSIPVLPVLQAPLRRQPHDIARPDLRRKFRHQRCERRNSASVFSPLYLASRPNAVRSAKNNRRMGSARSWMVRKMPVPKQQKKKRRSPGGCIHRFRNALIFSSVAISIPPCTKFQRKAVPVPPLLNGFLSMHRNVFSALYAAPHKKNPTTALRPVRFFRSSSYFVVFRFRPFFRLLLL